MTASLADRLESTETGMTSLRTSTRLPCGDRVLDLSHTHVMGILNITPDSFSDGGRYNNRDAALQRVEQMLAAGATLIDIGGESTRPGAALVSVQEEVDRVVPMVEAVKARFDTVVSIDTSTPEVIRGSAAVGAGLINDIRALTRAGAMQAAVDSGLAVCLMHMQGEPQTMQQAPVYDSVLAQVNSFLDERVQACLDAGIERSKLVLDPGFGFGKSLQHNLELFARMDQLSPPDLPILVGVSRKSMIGQALNRPVEQRLFGGLGLAALAVAKGARIIRVHDVAETADVVRMVDAVVAAGTSAI
ncbi:dihydropteroate synthase [Pseudomonas saudimassiliensis]|uniref:Dihydropteroate synthase n=2 Tax=Pseudomonas saudimassiliensis TaxID=1461581 RepID=A0A078MMX7_9PSED|nr:dihydropteroate synthase [Pseudomonas saudimassiliensis]CEF28083.1 dihydropteroate synthase [Pseudomonas saudimassiliensis]